MAKNIIFLAMILTISFVNSLAMAANAVFLKFTDRNSDENDYSEILSDLIFEKLVVSGKFKLKETAPLDISEERKLYEKNAAEYDNAKESMQTGNLDVLFSGEGFNKSKARSIDTAVTGQTIQPELIRAIAEKSGVDYLIQGTLENIGIYEKTDNSFGMVANIAVPVLATPFLAWSNSISLQRNFFGVEISLRIIEASTGKVVWDKKIIGQSHVTDFNTLLGSLKNNKWEDQTFHKAMNEAADSIVKAMVEDEESQKFF